MELRGQNVVVTGASSGIGAALARRLRRADIAGLALIDVEAEPLAALAEDLDAMPIVCDVGDRASVTEAVDAIESELGEIGLFCSNAGVLRLGGVEVLAPEWQRSWDVNVMAHVHACAVLVPRWCERGGGHLLITASAAGLLTQIGAAPYAVTKAAAVSLAEWIAISHGHEGVGVSVLCPQGVRTPMTDGMDESVVGVDGMAEPADVAEAAVEGVMADQFLILPHPEVATYVQRKGADRARWIAGMQRQARR